MQRELKIFSEITDILDAWSFAGCTGNPTDAGSVQRYTLKFLTERQYLTTEVLSYYQNTASWPESDIKMKIIDADFFSLPTGIWKNNGFTASPNGREVVCSLVIEMQSVVA